MVRTWAFVLQKPVSLLKGDVISHKDTVLWHVRQRKEKVLQTGQWSCHQGHVYLPMDGIFLGNSRGSPLFSFFPFSSPAPSYSSFQMLETLLCDNCWAFLGICSLRIFHFGLPSTLAPNPVKLSDPGMILSRCTVIRTAPVLRVEQGMELCWTGAPCFSALPIPFLLQCNWNERGEGWGNLTSLANLFLHHHLALAGTETQGFLPSLCERLWDMSSFSLLPNLRGTRLVRSLATAWKLH